MRRSRHIRISLYCAVLALSLSAKPVMAQPDQLSPGQIDELPDLPQPYDMRDWKAVARGSDSLMFDADAQGQYLPLVRYRRPYNGRRLTDSIFGVPSYVGDTRGEGLEGILTLPSVVSGLLVGIDKRSQGPDSVDYVRMSQDWFSRRDDEFVYLNLPLTSTGNDWWYETMPNVFFQHIYDLAGPYGAAGDQFVTLANQWRRAVGALGGSATPWEPGFFDYRSFRIRDLEPVASGVHQPEAAGAIGYVLQNAWLQTGDDRYRHAAEQALEYLDGLDANPRYELQLYYGAQAAARMNAIDRTNYDLDKIIGWTLSRGPLRGWGISTESATDGTDLHGLVGEVDRGNDYLFYMNGAQAVGALAPIARYDQRFARAIGKYVLNVANQSRLFFSNYLAPDNQDSYAWASTYDPNGYLAYEGLRQRLNGQSPFGTGDAVRLGWGPTNIGLYGSAHTGYLAAVVDTTDVEGILSLDLDATDFYGPEAYPTRLVYNPYDIEQLVTLRRPENAPGARELYELTASRFVDDVDADEDDLSLSVPAGEALVLVWAPASGSVVREAGRTLVDGVVVDYRRGAIAPEGMLRFKAAAFERDSLLAGDTARLHVIAEYNTGSQIDYEPLLDNLPFRLVGTERLDAQRVILLLEAGSGLGDYRVPVVARDPDNVNLGPDSDTASIRIVPVFSQTDDARGRVRELHVHPNPATATVQVGLPVDGTYHLSVTTLLGRVVLARRNLHLSDSSGTIDVSGLAPGVYQLSLKHNTTQHRYAGRLVVAQR